MKFLESHFDDYISSSTRINLHPKNEIIFNNFPSKLSGLSNTIFYGPAGLGKYTQALKLLSRYSPSELKYEKKICVTFNKMPYYLKISDIHYEVDMSLLGCNSKLLWHEIYLHIVDIISAKKDRIGVIVCKSFNQINSELLDNFYSYMQTEYSSNIILKFCILTSAISFLPETIINCCKVISVSKPSNTTFKKNFKPKEVTSTFDLSNLKMLSISNSSALSSPYKIICDCIIDNLINYQKIVFCKFRDLLYDMFIYDINIGDSIWYILDMLSKKGIITVVNISVVLTKTYEFFKYYNNNYRPIYHLENYFFTLIKHIYCL